MCPFPSPHPTVETLALKFSFKLLYILCKVKSIQDVLTAALAEAGIPLQQLVTYTTVEHTDLGVKLKATRHADVLVFFSPSG
jgi:uroporphyrinogen-III synthase